MPMILRNSAFIAGEFQCVDMDCIDTSSCKLVAIDTETTGLDPWGEYKVDRDAWPCRPFAVSLCDSLGNTAYIRWKVDYRTREVIRDKKSSNLLRLILEDEKIVKIFHNYQFDSRMLQKSGFKINGVCHDTLIRMHIMNPNELNYKLKYLSDKYLGISTDDEKDLKESTRKGRAEAKKKGWMIADDLEADYALADPSLCQRYAELDAERTMKLYLAQEQEYSENESLSRIYNRELKLMHALERMESRGVRLDKKRTEEVEAYYTELVDKSQKIIDEIAGKGFNPRSTKQKIELFFGKLKHTPLSYSIKNKRSKVYTDCMICKGEGCKCCQMTGRNPKCDGEFLESIGVDHGEDDEIIQKDKLAYNLLMNSAASTMLGYIRQYNNYCEKTKDGYIIHPNYKQAGPKTGRLSCARPNLQNVAADDSGKKRVDIKYRPRECFISREGFLLYVPDFSQIEVWILALLCGDEDMISALAEGGDAHQIVADLAYPDAYDRRKADKGDAEELRKKKQTRKITKTLNFGIIYGQGDPLTAKSLGCSVAEAKEFKQHYFRIFPAVKSFMTKTMKKAVEDGYVVNPFGRTYPIQRGLEYRATNYMVQGSAAEALKDGLVEVDNLARTKRYLGKLYPLLNIHDELMIEVRRDAHSKRTMKKVSLAMAADSEFLGCPIPFPVGMKVAEKRWNEAKEIDL